MKNNMKTKIKLFWETKTNREKQGYLNLMKKYNIFETSLKNITSNHIDKIYKWAHSE